MICRFYGEKFKPSCSAFRICFQNGWLTRGLHFYPIKFYSTDNFLEFIFRFYTHSNLDMNVPQFNADIYIIYCLSYRRKSFGDFFSRLEGMENLLDKISYYPIRTKTFFTFVQWTLLNRLAHWVKNFWDEIHPMNSSEKWRNNFPNLQPAITIF